MMENLPYRQKLTIFLAIMSAMFFSSLNQTIVGNALPQITAALGGHAYFNWVFTMFMLASSITAVLVGKLSDLYGRKPFLLTGIGVFLIGSFLNGTSESMLQLIIYRAVQGIGGGMVMSTAFTSIGDLFAPRERARWQGYMSLSFGTASLFGPTIGGYIIERFHWHWVFWLFLPFGLVAFVLIWRLFPSAVRVPEKQAIDLSGCLLLALTLLSLMLSFTLWGEHGGLSLVLLLSGAGLLALFLRNEQRAAHPVLPPHLFANRVFVISCVLNFLFGASMFANSMYTPLFIQNVMGLSPSLSGIIWLAFTVSMMLGSTLSGQRVTRTGTYKRAAMAGFVLMSLSMLFMTRLGMHDSQMVLILNLILFGLGIGINFPLFTLTAQNAAGYSNMGAATSSAQLFRQMGGTMGVSVMGLLLLSGQGTGAAALPDTRALEGDLHMVFLSLALMAMVSLLVAGRYLQEIPLMLKNSG